MNDMETGLFGWQEYAVMKDKDIERMHLPKNAPLTIGLSLLSMTGLTAYFGLLDIGQPKAGETVVVSGVFSLFLIQRNLHIQLLMTIYMTTGCRCNGIDSRTNRKDHGLQSDRNSRHRSKMQMAKGRSPIRPSTQLQRPFIRQETQSSNTKLHQHLLR